MSVSFDEDDLPVDLIPSAKARKLIADKVREQLGWYIWHAEWVGFWKALALYFIDAEAERLQDGDLVDPFEVLGIPVTADARAVKRAYAALVRLHPPEGDPNAFRRVREAYELALVLLELPPMEPVEWKYKTLPACYHCGGMDNLTLRPDGRWRCDHYACQPIPYRDPFQDP